MQQVNTRAVSELEASFCSLIVRVLAVSYEPPSSRSRTCGSASLFLSLHVYLHLHLYSTSTPTPTSICLAIYMHTMYATCYVARRNHQVGWRRDHQACQTISCPDPAEVEDVLSLLAQARNLGPDRCVTSLKLWGLRGGSLLCDRRA